MNLIMVYADLVRKVSAALANELAQMVVRLNQWASVDHRPSGRHHFPWTKVEFVAANFTGSAAMTWTVTQAMASNLSYRKIDNTITLRVVLISTTVGGVVAPILQIQLPQALAAKHFRAFGVGDAADNGVGTTILGQINQDASVLQILRTDGANWTASAANTTIRLTMDYEVAESAT